ncbi:MAG: SemiSWEET family transporter [Patescibacteria group bacterium]
MLSVHHLHKRKRVHKKLEPYPSPKFYKRLLDKVVFIAAIASPIMTVPQLLVIWTEKDAKGLSFPTWATYLLVASIWLIYGLVHKDRAITINSLLFVVVQSMIVLGIILFS